jgi:hypothetical protein
MDDLDGIVLDICIGRIMMLWKPFDDLSQGHAFLQASLAAHLESLISDNRVQRESKTG